MRKIELTKNKFSIIDDEDFESISRWKWHFSGGYAQRKTRDNKSISMHRQILNFPPNSFEIDHIDGDPLNNQKTNLRLCTRQQNSWNSKKKKGTSVYKGVTWTKERQKWLAQITVSGKNIKLGRFKREVDAAIAYNFAALHYFGEFARLNRIQILLIKPANFKHLNVCGRCRIHHCGCISRIS